MLGRDAISEYPLSGVAARPSEVVLTAYGDTAPSGVGSITISVTITEANSTLVVGPSAYDGSDGNNSKVSSITYDGNALTAAQSDPYPHGGQPGPDGSSNYLYAITGLSPGTHDLVVTFVGVCDSPAVSWAVFGNTATSVDASNKARTSSATSFPVSVTTVANNTRHWSYVSYVNGGGAGDISGADQLKLGTTAGGFIIHSASKTLKSPAGSVTHTYSETVSDDADVYIISLAPPTAGGTTVTPSTLSLTLTAFAPTVSVSANQTVTPGVVALTTTAFAPVIQHRINTGLATLTLTTFAPTANIGVNVVPSTTALTLTTFAPTVSTPVTVTPGVTALTLTALVPVIKHQVNTGLLSLSLTTFAPQLKLVVIPPVTSLTLTTFAPTVTVSSAQVVTPGTLALVLTTYAPTVTAGSSGGAGSSARFFMFFDN